MDEQVRQFLERINAQAQRKEESVRSFLKERTRAERDRELIRLGLCSREEADKLPAPYEEGEWRWDPEKEVYYRYRALELSEEEYQEVRAAASRLEQANAEVEKYRAPKKIGPFRLGAQRSARGTKYLGGNKLAVVFRVCAWALFVLGLNLGILFGASSEPMLKFARDAAGELQIAVQESAAASFDLARMLSVWVCFFVLGMLFYAISEALKLLQETRDAKTPDEKA